jgi:hypothetical protein
MSMPKGHKVDHGYGTLTNLGGKSYSEISDIMTDRGHKMNHSTARNVFLSSMKKIAAKTCKLYGLDTSESNIKRIACDPRFQESISILMNEDDEIR